MATATLVQTPDEIVTAPGSRTLEKEATEAKGKLLLLPPVKDRLTGRVERLETDGLLARPHELLFGALHDPALRLRKPIPLKTDKQEGIVSVSWQGTDLFGSGNSLSDAIYDFAVTIRELYTRLCEEGDPLSDHLMAVRAQLLEYIEPRTR